MANCFAVSMMFVYHNDVNRVTDFCCGFRLLAMSSVGRLAYLVLYLTLISSGNTGMVCYISLQVLHR